MLFIVEVIDNISFFIIVLPLWGQLTAPGKVGVGGALPAKEGS